MKNEKGDKMENLIKIVKDINKRVIVSGSKDVYFKAYFDKYEKAETFVKYLHEQLYIKENKDLLLSDESLSEQHYSIGPMLKNNKNEKSKDYYLYKEYKYTNKKLNNITYSVSNSRFTRSESEFNITGYYYEEMYKIKTELLFDNFTKLENDIVDGEIYKIFWFAEHTIELPLFED